MLYSSNYSLNGTVGTDYTLKYEIDYFNGTTFLSNSSFVNGTNNLTFQIQEYLILEICIEGATETIISAQDFSCYEDGSGDYFMVSAYCYFSNTTNTDFSLKYKVYPDGLVAPSFFSMYDGDGMGFEIQNNSEYDFIRFLQKLAYPTELAVFPVVGSSVDLIELNTKLDNLSTQITYNKDLLDLNLDGKISDISVDLSPIDLKLDNLSTQIINSSISFDSLDGESGTFDDGAIVNISGYDEDFTVVSSQMLKNDTMTYIVIYIVKDSEDKQFIVPSSTLTLKV